MREMSILIDNKEPQERFQADHINFIRVVSKDICICDILWPRWPMTTHLTQWNSCHHNKQGQTKFLKISNGWLSLSFVSPELVGNLVRGVRQTAYCFQIRFQVTIVIPLLPYAKFLMYVPCDTDGHYNIIIGCYFTSPCLWKLISLSHWSGMQFG